MNDYYSRTPATHSDGTPIFKTPEDEKNEQMIGELLGAAWNCTLHSFAKLTPIDWWAERDGRIVGVLELKCRAHDSAKYPTVFFSVRKWLGLSLAAVGLGVPALFVVRFTDCVRWIEVANVDAEDVTISGCFPAIRKSRADVEPLIEVPVRDMHELISKGKNEP
jgi:hypothetical protein